MKKLKKQAKGIMEVSFLGATGSIGLSAIGGGVAAHGQAGIARATRFLPTMGTVAGLGAVMRTTDSLFNKKKRK